ncbi:MAG: hypothetical protein KJ000_25515 [Pirellulaceae bacterium]|nr:hypothetical protein [Pirellulaceae bacterium]
MSRLHFVGWLCVGCWFVALLGCGCGGSSDPSVASSDSGGYQQDAEHAAESSQNDPTQGTGNAASQDEHAETSETPEASSEEGAGAPMSEQDPEHSETSEEPREETAGTDEEHSETSSEEMVESTPETSDSPSTEGGYTGEESGAEGATEGGQGTAKTTTYAQLAQRAFRQGDDPLALRYLMAHAVTADPEEAKLLLDKMGFNARVKRPSFAVRWGVGIEFIRPPNYNGSIFPIGTSQNIAVKPVRGAGDGGLGEGAGIGATTGEGDFTGGRSPIPQAVKQLTGELGEKIVEQFTLRLDRGDYGDVLKTPPAASADGGATTYGGQYGESGYEGGYGGAQPGAQNQGPRSIVPGVALIDIGSAKDLVAKAKQAGVDVLCVFKIAIVLNPRAQLVINNTSLLIFDVATGKEVFGTKPLNNIEVQKDRMEGKPDDVAKALVAMFEHVDQTWKLGPVPAMEPQQVLTRIGAILNEGPGANPLPALAEVRMYHSRGLLQDNHLELAYQRLLGDEQAGRVLATGTVEEKRAVIEKYMSTAPRETGPRDILQGTDS